jgi:hypothetical protein
MKKSGIWAAAWFGLALFLSTAAPRHAEAQTKTPPPAGGVELEGFLYHPDMKDVIHGCALKTEDNITDIKSVYIPETEQFYFEYTTASAEEALDKDKLTPEEKAAIETKGYHQNAFWLVVSPGENPKHHETEFSIMYVDLEINRIAFYAYDGVNGPFSYERSEYLGAVDGVIDVKNTGDLQTVSFLLDVKTLNEAINSKEWLGIELGKKAGLWFHTAFGADIQYGGNTDTTPTPTEACAVAGCSGQLCVAASEAKETVSTCEWKESYACYKKYGKCGKTAPGKCGWLPSADFDACLKETGATAESSASGNASSEIKETVTIKKFAFTKAGTYHDVGNKDTVPVTIITKTKEKADLKDVAGAANKGGLGANPGAILGKDGNKRFAWCTLHDDLISHAELGLGNVAMVSVAGPKYGFTDMDTVDLACLSSFKLYIDASIDVDGITVEANGKEPVKMRLETPQEPQKDKKRFVKAGAEKRFLVSNTDGENGELFGYGKNEFTLTLSVGGKEVKEEHRLIIPRP